MVFRQFTSHLPSPTFGQFLAHALAADARSETGLSRSRDNRSASPPANVFTPEYRIQMSLRPEMSFIKFLLQARRVSLPKTWSFFALWCSYLAPHLPQARSGHPWSQTSKTWLTCGIRVQTVSIHDEHHGRAGETLLVFQNQSRRRDKRESLS